MTHHSAPPRTYTLAGLQIVSEFQLPETLRSQGTPIGNETVRILRASVPEFLPSSVTFPEVQIDGNSMLISIPRIARFLVRDGYEVLVQADADASPRDIETFLLGTVFGALCHQRGILPMHATAIDVSSGCVIFAGHSGAGKSTLAAALGARGYQVISDDVCFLREGEDKNILVWPGIGRIRLWPDAINALNLDRSKFERELRGYNKYLIPVKPPKDAIAPRRLLRVYQLAASSADKEPSVVQLQGAKSIELLVPNVYRLTLAEHLGAKPAIFSLCTTIAQQVPIYEFRRPLSFDVLPLALEILERHLKDAQ